MSMPPDPNRPGGPLARVGQSDSFAGFTRLWMVVGGVIIAWAGFDLRSALSDIKENQVAIRAIGDRTTRVEGQTDTVASSLKEFRYWAEGRVQGLDVDVKDDNRRLYAVETAQGRTATRIKCLEHRTVCPE